MQMAVGFSLILLVLVVNVPFLQPIFNTSALSLAQWGIVVAFALMPALAEEITKWWLRRQKI
jgi:Ca2+-transporting ATPase